MVNPAVDLKYWSVTSDSVSEGGDEVRLYRRKESIVDAIVFLGENKETLEWG